jgi:hypothetical protein
LFDVLAHLSNRADVCEMLRGKQRPKSTIAELVEFGGKLREAEFAGPRAAPTYFLFLSAPARSPQASTFDGASASRIGDARGA